jgi:opacity protein-like surface antigen
MKAKIAGWTCGLAFLAAVAAAPAAYADANRAGTWETRLGILFTNSSNWDFEGGTKADIKSDQSFLVGAGYHMSDQLEFGGNFTYGQTDYTADIAGDLNGDGIQDNTYSVRGEYESSTLLFDATWNFMPGNFTPYVTANAGWAWIDTNIATGPPQTGCWWDPWWGYVCTTFQNTKSLDGFSYGLGIGARYDFNRSYAIKAAYRMQWVDISNAKGTPDIDGFELTFGWKF